MSDPMEPESSLETQSSVHSTLDPGSASALESGVLNPSKSQSLFQAAEPDSSGVQSPEPSVTTSSPVCAAESDSTTKLLSPDPSTFSLSPTGPRILLHAVESDTSGVQSPDPSTRSLSPSKSQSLMQAADTSSGFQSPEPSSTSFSLPRRAGKSDVQSDADSTSLSIDDSKVEDLAQEIPTIVIDAGQPSCSNQPAIQKADVPLSMIHEPPLKHPHIEEHGDDEDSDESSEPLPEQQQQQADVDDISAKSSTSDENDSGSELNGPHPSEEHIQAEINRDIRQMKRIGIFLTVVGVILGSALGGYVGYRLLTAGQSGPNGSSILPDNVTDLNITNLFEN